MIPQELVELVRQASSFEFNKSKDCLARESSDRSRRLTHRRMDEALLKCSPAGALACSAGCGFCCHLRVVATAAEVFGMVDYLRSNLSDQDFSDFRRRVDAAVKLIEPMTALEHTRTKVQGPALVDGRCIAYAARPMMCRSYHSVDVSRCKSLYETPQGDEPIPYLMARKLFGEHHIRAWQEALRVNGFDANDYELLRALQQAMCSDAAKRRYEDKGLAFAFEPEPSPSQG